MPSRATRDEHKKRRWKPEEDLARAKKNIDDLLKEIKHTEKKINKLTESKEKIQDQNKWLKSGILEEGKNASRVRLESGTLRLQECQTYNAEQKLRLNELKRSNMELEAWKKEWEAWREDIEEEYRRRAVFEARIRKARPQSYEN
ncbi:uncharacterized protein FTJAE_10664 [Fusarium tjaetaba]|uniref:Uncharacterized protein n=1 Tax=Fusarium tjaetaba TaxID=1567544 RepID=A0A8H5QXV1_9HYPO|nr:uncharacterized protein FTJAE_10664 [Fusarium tjaetaba]KAF5623277.1 hypothetical protein FTJAE_10664 [Fusarium tjaetaba]